MKKIQVLISSFYFGSLSDLCNTREKIYYTNKAERIDSINKTYDFDSLKARYQKGYDYYGKIVKGFHNDIYGEAFLTKNEIIEIISWDTNLIVFNMHSGKEY